MLFVNFDREILQLIREAKQLQRMGIEIPESARMVLLQVIIRKILLLQSLSKDFHYLKNTCLSRH